MVCDGRVIARWRRPRPHAIWSRADDVMNQYVITHGGKRLGDLRIQHRVAAGSRLPAFRRSALGNNAVDDTATGYDLLTELGGQTS